LKLTKSIVLIVSLCAVLSVVRSAAAGTLNFTIRGGYVSSIEGIVVDDVTYTAYVHINTNFATIWDPNVDGDYSDSSTGAAPAFLGNQAGALSAAQQVMAAMGNSDLFIGGISPSDSFAIP
jgi:hypothetical protein